MSGLGEIESWRSEISRLARENYSLDIFLDKVSGASGDEVDEAGRQLSANNARKNRLAENLRVRVTDLRRSAPDSFRRWVALHRKTCDAIAASCADPTDTRGFVARRTREEWDGVEAGRQEFVVPNPYYLSDYDRFRDRVFAEAFPDWKLVAVPK